MQPSDLDIQAELEAIDATLAGEAVDPEHAEVAELSLLLAAERPRMSDDFARELDRRVALRFQPLPADARPLRRRWIPRPAWGGGVAVAAAVVAAIVVLASPSGGGSSGSFNGSSSPSSASGAASGAAPAAAQGVLRAPGGAAARHTRSAAGALAAKQAPNAVYAPAASTPAPSPNGRRQIQSAQLQLTAANSRIDTVAQELFDVIGQENGVVQSSHITSSSVDGYALFSLEIPSANLTDTLTRLSDLRYAQVASRTDATQDVNNSYLADVRRLADARALRTALLKQLAAATTADQVTSLTAQIHDAEASIASDEATLHGLQHQISFSRLSVQINAAAPLPVDHPATGSGSGFTLGHAARDALKVLTVAAGVALIVLAALIPVGLLVALGAWIAYWIRRRRREHALDAA
jgi:hypothetical protein